MAIGFGLFNRDKKKDDQKSSDDGKTVSDYHTPTPFRTTPDPRPWVYSRTEPQADEQNEDKQEE